MNCKKRARTSHLLKRSGFRQIVAADVVEVAPPFDPSGSTVRLGALTMLHTISEIELQKKSVDTASV